MSDSGPWGNLGFLFFACLAAGISLVYLFCLKKFAERSVTENSDYIYQLLPKQLATREEYSKGFLIYFGSMAAMVALLALIGQSNQANLSMLGITLTKDASNVILPLAIALILIGALPTVPGLMLVEKYLRDYAHQRAYIPDAARATADRLAAADFDFSSYRGEALQSPELRGVEATDFTRSRHTLEYGWARLCCLVFIQKSCRMEGLTDSLDASLLRDYEKDLELIESQKKSMEAEIAAYRAAKANDAYYANEPLRRAIRDNLYKLYILLGCAVRLKQHPLDDVDLVLGKFGFKLNHPTRAQDTGDLKLVGLAAVAVSICLLGLAATGVGQLATRWSTIASLWQLSVVFPATVFQPFIDTVSTLIPHLTAIIAADMMRRHAIDTGTWFKAYGARQRANSANYIRVALVCGVAGYVALISWGLTQASPSLDGFKIEVSNALLAIATGWFYVYHLDNVELDQRPSRVWELGSQTIVTGFGGFIAACATWQIIEIPGGVPVDKIVLTTLINASVGFVFAWYIPRAAAAARPDPLVEAKEERIRALEAAALARFNSPAQATAWLEQPHPVLGKSPKAAAADVDGYEHAISLLQGPPSLVA